MKTVDDAIAALPPRVGAPDLVHQLKGRVQTTRRAVRSHQAIPAATNANWIARLADEMSSSYEAIVPADARLLAFFGRAIEVDAKGHRDRVKADLADLRTVWGRVEPMVLQRHGAAVARQFGDNLAQLDGAVRNGRLAQAAAAEVSTSEQVVAALRAAPAAQ
ncbi:MAG TPA: hypothetical protein VFA27_00750 [Vicinamibacterales bacterium]|nr:hypothetical protein [Vicinamibacterales bacterium]